jgi:hypothetical protein
MSWATRGTIASKQNRMKVIEKRTMETSIPPLEVLFSTFVKEGNSKMTRDLIDSVYYSSFPAKDASVALSALSMNVKNIDGLRKSGSLGVVLDMLQRIDFDSNPDPNHIADLVRSVSILSDSIQMQSRILSNPHAVSSILKLCIKTHGDVQQRIFQVLDGLCRTENGTEIFLQQNVFDVLISSELLARGSTPLDVRHSTANLVNRMATMQPRHFPVSKMQDVIIVNSTRVVDGYIEVQLLHALYAHLSWLAAEKLDLEKCDIILLHLVNEVKSETFEDLEHVLPSQLLNHLLSDIIFSSQLLLILKCIVIVSRESHHGSYLLKHDLSIALQYVVRTDFELWRKRVDPYLRPQTAPESVGPSRSVSAPIRRTGTTNTLEAIRGIKSIKSRKLEDINFKTTRLVVLIYENVIKLGVTVIGEIVSTGLIAGLLFRVGKGKNIDKRFHKLVVHFLYLILVKVATEQPPALRPMSVVNLIQPIAYTRAGTRRPSNPPPRLISTMINQRVEPITVRSVTYKLHANGVTDLLVYCLEGEDYEIVSDAMISLASMHFACIKGHILKEYTLGKISGYALARKDCFFAGLSLICEVTSLLLKC